MQVTQLIPNDLMKQTEIRIKGLSRVFYSSIRYVRNAYLRFTKGFWKPYIDYNVNGVLQIEGYKIRFRQLVPDIQGGKGRDDSGNFFYLRGGNQLEKVRLIPIIDVLGRKIAVLVLQFKGEEHPIPGIDSFYRLFRALAFRRLKDIEAIGLEFFRDKLVFSFLGICSGKKTFANKIGVHKTCKVSNDKTNVDLYVSNVWNHAMATWNTNPSLPDEQVKPKLFVGGLRVKEVVPGLSFQT